MSKSTTLKGTEFNFAAQPNVVRAKKKYRTANGQDYDPENFRYQNVMFEKRVVRGNTHSQYMVANNEVEEAPLPQQRRGRNQINRHSQQSFDDNGETGSADYNFRGMQLQEPEGCKFQESYTDDGVETETDLPPCHDATTQTEWIIEKKIPDLSMPVYHGISKETQIYSSDNLFDFNYESEPIVQVLVTRCLEESRIEVCEEEELHALKSRQIYIQKYTKNEQEQLNQLQKREIQKHQDHEQFLARKKRQKADLINVHQHMVARVFSQRYISDISNAAFEILDNMCYFMDESEKKIKDEFMPWLYEETISQGKRHLSITSKVDSLVTQLESGIVKTHKIIVADENEVKRLQQEEEDRLAREKAEAKAAKLAWKLQRRLDRRLFHLENEIMEKFITGADNDLDIVNISDFDGSDNDGNKTIGFRGGVIGEFYKLIQNIKKMEEFKDFDFKNETVVQNLFSNVFKEFVPDGWTMMIGLKPEFESNFAYRIGDFQISELTPNYVREQEYDEDYQMSLDYILKHYVSVYDQMHLPEIRTLQQTQLAKLRPPPEKFKTEQDENAEKKQGGDGDEEEGDEEQVEAVQNLVMAIDNVEGSQDEETDEELYEKLSEVAKDYKFIVDAVLTKILQKNSSINNVKFTLVQEFENKPQDEDKEGLKGDEGTGDDETKPKNDKPLALCVFLPEPIPEETAEDDEVNNKADDNDEDDQDEKERTGEEVYIY